MRSKISKNTRFILITGFVVFLILIMIIPVSAELRTISKGATIFIGESNLDISNAVGSSTKIGWWASGSTSTNPAYTVDVSSNSKSFTVGPENFVGRTGNWYALTETNTKDVAFNVQDPYLSIAVWDFQQGKDVTGPLIMQGGGHLGIKVNTNMDAATNQQYRPNANAATDGYINIKWKSEDGHIQNNLLMGTLGSTTSTSTLNQYVNIQPWYFGTANNYWVTEATDTSGQYVYPAGFYTFWAESKLNNMIQNYKNTGADYTGKTISKTIFFKLISSSVGIRTDKDSVICGDNQRFGIYISAAPSSTYDLYINNGDVSGITPPTVDANLQYTYPLISPGHYQIKVDADGFGGIPFTTSSQTTPRIYTFKLVDPKGTQKEAQINFEVLPAPPQPTGSIVVQSSPAGATIFLDNAIKGITPLTIQSVPNGAHIVLLQLKGYQDSSNNINVLGDTQTINPTLTPSNAPTTGVTTVATTGSVTSTPTTGIITTQFTTSATTTTPITMATVNYSETIEALEKQIAEQNAKIEEQGSWIDQILRFLGLK